MRILICGDSYCVTDPSFPNLHWSEKILNHSSDYEVCNLAYGGSSNALIAMQLLQGLQLKPDFVVLSFTDEGRYELDKNVSAMPADLSSAELSHYLKERYSTNRRAIDANDKNVLKIISQYMTVASSENFEKIKNYFYILFCLRTLQARGIDFCFSLGGFEYKQDYTALLKSNFVENIIGSDFREFELHTNLWYYGNELVPFFHVKDERTHTLFANECISRINLSRADC